MLITQNDLVKNLLNGLAGQEMEEPQPPEFVPVKKIIDEYTSRATFYSRIKAAGITLHKPGKRSYIRTTDFITAFRPRPVQAVGNEKTGNI